ncbi:hypothetical protein NPIL_508251 [Nephila pilipes]|uniref:Uncharacterized protein n=1 Tax=Nephila pilipes TaxID=299642 RepID=A0A8X6MYG2_NEPPI|nr:hypothetical protein NPIL_508251 [Nephila pilipes]
MSSGLSFFTRVLPVLCQPKRSWMLIELHWSGFFPKWVQIVYQSASGSNRDDYVIVSFSGEREEYFTPGLAINVTGLSDQLGVRHIGFLRSDPGDQVPLKRSSGGMRRWSSASDPLLCRLKGTGLRSGWGRDDIRIPRPAVCALIWGNEGG